MLLTCGAFTPDGEFLELPDLDMARLEATWQEAVFALYLSEGKIEPEAMFGARGHCLVLGDIAILQVGRLAPI